MHSNGDRLGESLLLLRPLISHLFIMNRKKTFNEKGQSPCEGEKKRVLSLPF